MVADAEGNEMVLKLHRCVSLRHSSPGILIQIRLGRVSFRAIKSKRDYMGKRKSASWMYMSRLSAQKEWAFMKVSWVQYHVRFNLILGQVLHEHGFPVPRPIDQARHCILMGYIDAYPLYVLGPFLSPAWLKVV